jgi:hypothetical protein
MYIRVFNTYIFLAVVGLQNIQRLRKFLLV